MEFGLWYDRNEGRSNAEVRKPKRVQFLHYHSISHRTHLSSLFIVGASMDTSMDAWQGVPLASTGNSTSKTKTLEKPSSARGITMKTAPDTFLVHTQSRCPSPRVSNHGTPLNPPRSRSRRWRRLLRLIKHWPMGRVEFPPVVVGVVFHPNW